jgi:transcriptional regulator with XRE-family HTH domain
MMIAELERNLGLQVRNVRLRQNISQQTLADQAGVALTSVKNLEAGKGTTITSFIKVIRALRKEDWLTTFAPESSISPIQILKMKRPRQRASKTSINKRGK